MSYHVSMIYSYAKKIKDIRASPHNNCRPPGRGTALAPGRSRLEAGGGSGPEPTAASRLRLEAGAGGSGMKGGGRPPPLKDRRRSSAEILDR